MSSPRCRWRDDGGFTLVVVMGALAVLTAILLGSLGYALQGMAPNRKDQDAKASVAAAQAGIDDFISRLNVDDRYWANNSWDTYHPSGDHPSGDNSNAALKPAGTPMPGTGAGPVTYHYAVLTTARETTSTGVIRLQSTGHSRDASRTLIAQLEQSGFPRHMDSGDVETQDQAPVVLPATNSEIQQYADSTKTDVDAPGCQYSGQTQIRFQGKKMRVLSPSTTSGTKPRCYDTATPTREQVVDIPKVIYVQDLAGACGSGGIDYPIPGESATYDCHVGDAFVQGTVTGQVTVATANDIVVTGDLKTTTNNLTGTDVIGLIANNYVWVHHPVTTGGANVLTPANSVHEIDAAVLAVRHSFLVQNMDQGAPLSTVGDDPSKLKVQGAIAQKLPGPVGTPSGSAISTGYLKNYVYDPRLLTLLPPYFLKPVSAPWGVTKLSE